LRGDVRGERAPVRPPWALPEALFTDRCSRCGDCIDACPEHLLAARGGGYPAVDFDGAACTFCGQCVGACRDSALLREGTARPWTLHAYITERCLARDTTVCTTCAEYCEAKAISFVPRVGTVAQPMLDRECCTGCGACYAACPVRAITMR